MPDAKCLPLMPGPWSLVPGACPPPLPSPLVPRLPLILSILAIAIALALRVGGASDLGQNTDQSKTLAFTADAVVNGRWALPRDSEGVPALKPPLINWLAAPAYAAGLRSELALKLPAVLCGLGVAALTAFAARRLLRRLDTDPRHPADPKLAALATPLAFAAAAAWICSPAGVKHTYFFRPDILLVCCLTAGWLCATIAVERRSLKATAAMWIFAGLAALAKGPLAILVPLYAIALALTTTSDTARWRRAASLGWLWGVPIMLAIPGAWLFAAWRVDPTFIEHTLLGGELVSRVERGSTESDPLRVFTAVARVPAFAFERFSPWAPLAIIGVIAMGLRAWRRPLWPALLWVILVYAINVLAAGGSGTPLLPAYPALAILGVYGLARLLAGNDGRRASVMPTLAAVLALVFGVLFGVRESVAIPGLERLSSRAAQTRYGDTIKRFARTARETVSDETVVFVGTDHNPVATLMGRVRLGEPTAQEITAAQWIVIPIDQRFEASVVTHGPLTRLHAESGAVRDEDPGLGLYRAAQIPPDVLRRPDPSQAD